MISADATPNPTANRAARLSSLSDVLRQNIIGQDHVLGRVEAVLRRGELGLTHPRRPKGSFLFLGPTGVGKTELTLTFTGISSARARSPVSICPNIRNRNRSACCSANIATRRGIIGTRIKKPGTKVILWDEIEKAHALVLDLLLQMLDAGRITGATGSGKTASIIMRILFGLCTHVPDWGGMALDDKGLFYRILVKMFRFFGRENHLRLIQVRPDDAPADWKPSDTWNPLDDKTMPYSAHAKIICDVAASFSSNSHPFFSQMAQIAMEYAMRGLDVADHYVTLTQVYNVTTNDDDLKALLTDLSKIEGALAREAAEVDEYFTTRFLTLPPETLGGLRGEMVRYLKFFTDERLAEIFSPKTRHRPIGRDGSVSRHLYQHPSEVCDRASLHQYAGKILFLPPCVAPL